jgi:hypothetical protein
MPTLHEQGAARARQPGFRAAPQSLRRHQGVGISPTALQIPVKRRLTRGVFDASCRDVPYAKSASLESPTDRRKPDGG